MSHEECLRLFWSQASALRCFPILQIQTLPSKYRPAETREVVGGCTSGRLGQGKCEPAWRRGWDWPGPHGLHSNSCPLGLTQGPRICISDFAGTNLSSPIGNASKWDVVRGINSPYSQLHDIQPQFCNGYEAVQLFSLVQQELRLGCPSIWKNRLISYAAFLKIKDSLMKLTNRSGSQNIMEPNYIEEENVKWN